MANTTEPPMPRPKNSMKLLMNDVGANMATTMVYIKIHNKVTGIKA